MGKHKLCELKEESSGWLGVGPWVRGGDINSGYNGVRWEGGGQGSDHIKKVVSILDMGGEGFNKGLEVGIVGRDAFGKKTTGGDDGVPGLCILGR